MQLAAILLSLAALGGIVMVVIRLKGAPLPPTGLATAHGVIAGIGVLVLAYNAYTPGIPQLAQFALGIFVLAALRGVTLFAMFHSKARPLPIPPCSATASSPPPASGCSSTSSTARRSGPHVAPEFSKFVMKVNSRFARVKFLRRMHAGSRSRTPFFDNSTITKKPPRPSSVLGSRRFCAPHANEFCRVTSHQRPQKAQLTPLANSF